MTSKEKGAGTLSLEIPGSARKSYARIPDVLGLPNLIQTQLDSYRWFRDEGLGELFEEISVIKDFTGTKLELHFLDPDIKDPLNPDKDNPNYGKAKYRFRDPKYSEQECRERDMTYAAPLMVTMWLRVIEAGEIKEQELFMGDFPLMTDEGTFMINGAERVVISQLIRSPGVYFTIEQDLTSGRGLCFAKLIPNRGAWLEFETSNKDVISVKVDRKRKIPISTLLRAIGYGSDEQLAELFEEVDVHPDHHYLKATIGRDPNVSSEEAQIDFYKQ